MGSSHQMKGNRDKNIEGKAIFTFDIVKLIVKLQGLEQIIKTLLKAMESQVKLKGKPQFRKDF